MTIKNSAKPGLVVYTFGVQGWPGQKRETLFEKQAKNQRTGVDCLPSKHKVLISIPSTTKNKNKNKCHYKFTRIVNMKKIDTMESIQ
jgi:hypothetical protein